MTGVSRRLSIDKDLTSGANVSFRISAYLAEQMTSEILKFDVPKFPRKIDSSNGIFYTAGQPIYQPLTGASTSSYTILRYYVQEIENETSKKRLIFKTSASPTTLSVGDDVQFYLADTRLTGIDLRTEQIVYINRSQNNIVFNLPKTTLDPISPSVGSAMIGINKLVEVKNTVIARKFKITIADRSIYEYMEKTDYIRHVPIFAYSQSIDSTFSANDPKYLMTPIVSNGYSSDLITSTVPPYSSASVFVGKQSNTSSIRNISTRGRFFRFFVAIAEYSRTSTSASWTGKWLQTDNNGKPLWKVASKA